MNDRETPYRPLVLVALMLLAMWAGAAVIVWRERADVLSNSRQLTGALSRVVAERLAGALQAHDALLGELAALPPTTKAADGLAPIRQRASALPEIRAAFVVDGAGRVTLSTLAGMAGQDLSGQPFFRNLRNPGRGGMVIMPPSPGFQRGGVVVARPILGRLGNFTGAAGLVVEPAFFGRALGGAMTGATDRAILANLDGDVLARLPAVGDGTEPLSIRNGPLFTHYLPAARSGAFVAPSGIDGQDRLASYEVVDNFPLVVSSGATIRLILERWTTNTALLAAGGGVFSLVILAIAWRMERGEKLRRQAKEALRAGEESLRLLINDQSDLIHRYAPDTTLLTVNRAYARFYGDQPDRLVGRRWIEFLPEEERPFVMSCLRALSRAQPDREDHRRVIRHDGVERWIEWRTTALFDTRDNLVGYQTVGRDVTDAHLAQQAVSEREELYSQSFHRNSAIKLLIDPKSGQITDANDSAAVYYGYPMEVLKRMNIRDISTATPEETARELTMVEAEGRRFMRFRHRLASGGIRDVEVYSSPLHVGGRAYLSSIVVDVTDRNRFEAELEAKSAELARSNGELEQFAYAVSHDLRQPLRMVSSYLGLLHRRLGDQLAGEAAEFIGYAVAGAKRMDALITGLLDYARAGRDGGALEPMEVGWAVEAAMANLGLDHPDGAARVTVETPLPAIKGIRGELVRLFQNLLGNAIKYRSPDRFPEIRIGARREDGEWIIWISDNGRGIPGGQVERVFMIFQRLENGAEQEGTGIGLAICRKIAGAHHGRIWAESTEGEGTTFLLALPAIP